MSNKLYDIGLTISEVVSVEMTIQKEIDSLEKQIIQTINDVQDLSLSEVIRGGLRQNLEYQRGKRANLQDSLIKFGSSRLNK